MEQIGQSRILTLGCLKLHPQGNSLSIIDFHSSSVHVLERDIFKVDCVLKAHIKIV